MNMITLQDRVLRLEKQNRRAKRLLLCAAAIMGSVPLLAFGVSDRPESASFDIVYASKFVVRDSRTGVTRATFAHQTMEGGWAGITLWDNDGQPRAEFKLWEDGRSHLLLMDEHRRELSRLSVSHGGDARLGLGSEIVLKGWASNKVMQTDRPSADR